MPEPTIWNRSMRTSGMARWAGMSIIVASTAARCMSLYRVAGLCRNQTVSRNQLIPAGIKCVFFVAFFSFPSCWQIPICAEQLGLQRRTSLSNLESCECGSLWSYRRRNRTAL